MTTLDLTFDTAKPQNQIQVLHARQGDNDLKVYVYVYENGIEYDFTGKHLEFACIKPKCKEYPDGAWTHIGEGFKHIGQTNIWEFTIPATVTDTAGVIELAYFIVKKDDDPHYRETMETFNIYVDPSATFEAKVGYYSDQVTNMLLTAETLIQAWEDQMTRQDKEFQAALKDFMTKYEAVVNERDRKLTEAEKKRQETFETNEAERERIYKLAEQLVSSSLEDTLTLNQLYLETNWKDTENGFVSTKTFKSLQTEFRDSQIPYLSNEEFLKAVFNE